MGVEGPAVRSVLPEGKKWGEGRHEPHLGFSRCDRQCWLFSALGYEVMPQQQEEASKCSLLLSWLHQAQTMNLLTKEVGEERVRVNNKGCISLSMTLWLKKHNYPGVLGNVIVEDRTRGFAWFVCLFWDRVSYSQGWPLTPWEAKDDLDISILLPLEPVDYRCAHHHAVLYCYGD